MAAATFFVATVVLQLEGEGGGPIDLQLAQHQGQERGGQQLSQLQQAWRCGLGLAGLKSVGSPKAGVKEGNKEQPSINQDLNGGGGTLGQFGRLEMTFPGFKDNLDSPAQAVDFGDLDRVEFLGGNIGDENGPAQQGQI